MTEPTGTAWRIFLEVFESLPRQGPGSRACAERALGLCSDLPASPSILDLGCGVGGQTLHLAELLPESSIVAIDSHAPNIERLRLTVAQADLAHRIQPLVGDIDRPDLPSKTFDLIWSEGALYNIGVEDALRTYQELMLPGGYFAFTEAVWRRSDQPSEVEALFADYPGMGSVPDVLATIERSGLTLIGHFTLPGEAWWTDFYTPMERRIEELRGKYSDDDEALAALDQIAQEPDLHRRHSDTYAYEFFVLRES